MSNWIEWALETQSMGARITRVFVYVFKCHMSWAWLIAYGGLAYIAWPCLSTWQAVLVLNAGAILFVLTMLSLAREQREFHQVRNAFHDFADSFRADLLWQSASEKSRNEFARLQGAITKLGRWLVAFPKSGREQ